MEAFIQNGWLLQHQLDQQKMEHQQQIEKILNFSLIEQIVYQDLGWPIDCFGELGLYVLDVLQAYICWT